MKKDKVSRNDKMFEVLAIVVVLVAAELGLVVDSDEILFCADSVALTKKSFFRSRCPGSLML